MNIKNLRVLFAQDTWHVMNRKKKDSNVAGPSSASTENPVTNHTDTQEKWAILETEDESIGGGSWEVAIKQHH